MAKRAEGKRWKTRWAIGSLLLHALLLTFAATRQQRPLAAPPVTRKPLAELEVEVVPTSAAPDDTALSPSAEPTARATRVQGAAPANEAALGRAPVDNAAVPEDVAAEVAGEEPGAPAAASSAARRLGLAELGLAGPNPFLERQAKPPSRGDQRASVKKRLDRELAQGLMNQDTAVGLGAGSPVMRSLEAAVYASTAPLNGNASFIFVVDSDGKLVSSTVGDVNAERGAWERVARQTAQALAQRKLRVPKGKSVRLTVAVTSHLEMPSGRDPGLELRAFGIPLKKGDGERSTRIDLLNPLHPSVPFLLDGDPVDAGARPRRMVRSHVVSEELL